jgi:hypothetical protein
VQATPAFAAPFATHLPVAVSHHALATQSPSCAQAALHVVPAPLHP